VRLLKCVRKKLAISYEKQYPGITFVFYYDELNFYPTNSSEFP